MVKPRPPQLTVKCVDTYCELYRDLFIEVRAYEAFKYLHLGIIGDLKRKSLPEIAKAVGLNNIQLILQPYIYFNLILKWLKICPIPQLTLGFPRLIAKINEIDYLHYLVYLWDDFCYSSA